VGVSRFPALSTAGEAVPASIFARLRERLARYRGDVIPLQIGDTHLPPAARLEAIDWRAHRDDELYAYNQPAGWPPLLDALADRSVRRGVRGAAIQVGCGATHALSAAVQAVCDPGDEIILLSPHWPLIRGIALGFNVVPVQVPLAGGIAAIEAAVTARTAAIYFASPNNPDGTMLPAATLAVLAALARRRDLWILADEVYEHYAYDAPHASIAALPDAADRTITVYSFAKSYAQAGLRVGYAVAPEPVALAMRRIINHTVYNVPVAMQRAALAAIEDGDGFLAEARDRYRDARDRASARLDAPAEKPPGGAYLWVDLRPYAGDDCMPVLEQIAERGVLIAPGAAFGPADSCGGFARLCFTGVEPARLDEGIDRINAVLATFRQ
jgi:aspartate/methionine/tyrosine aminotransferase